ncbi:unnamed protein product [Darwinula stevensoni]|uniref:EGF-like domain-containing protein n=1 Tax=Darwinula stevensoni TaxID=69355 RepID=A0A7R8XG14_9CRUS|nr:unnamed protein product [Darwinula stevensoni]CAG0895592.1 unnamed protein product [Darwinula stevensoni]
MTPSNVCSTGEKFQSRLEGGRPGDKCNENCKCKKNAACDLETEKCVCERGWTGDNCDERCLPGSYGRNCELRCPDCRKGNGTLLDLVRMSLKIATTWTDSARVETATMVKIAKSALQIDLDGIAKRDATAETVVTVYTSPEHVPASVAGWGRNANFLVPKALSAMAASRNATALTDVDATRRMGNASVWVSGCQEGRRKVILPGKF